MEITQYNVELDEDLHSMLVVQKKFEYPLRASLNTPKEVVEMLNSIFRLNKQAEEFIYMIAFTIKMRPLGVFEVSHGTINLAPCNPREIFIRALLCGAGNISLAHNHPSMDVTPSRLDVQVYEQMKRAGDLLGINLIDFIILGDGYYSFATQYENTNS